MAEIKFCGMTQSADARHAATLGADFVGVILAEGPRTLTNDAAQQVFAAVPRGIARVGVFGVASPEQVASRAERVGLDVVQLHGDPDVATIEGLRQLWPGKIWAVLRLDGAELPEDSAELFDVADAVVLDAHVAGKLGGTGVALAWDALNDRLDDLRNRAARLVLAGGLTPENVARAIGTLRPDVVDVSSGVESRVGIKDHDRMREFRDAVRALALR